MLLRMTSTCVAKAGLELLILASISQVLEYGHISPYPTCLLLKCLETSFHRAQAGKNMCSRELGRQVLKKVMEVEENWLPLESSSQMYSCSLLSKTSSDLVEGHPMKYLISTPQSFQGHLKQEKSEKLSQAKRSRWWPGMVHVFRCFSPSLCDCCFGFEMR